MQKITSLYRLLVVICVAIRGTLFTVAYEHTIDILSELTASAASLKYATHHIIMCAQIIIKRIKKSGPLSSAMFVTVGKINDPISFCNCIFQAKPGWSAGKL